MSEIRVNAPNGHDADGPLGVLAEVEPSAAERADSNRRRERREVTLCKGSLAVPGCTLEVMDAFRGLPQPDSNERANHPGLDEPLRPKRRTSAIPRPSLIRARTVVGDRSRTALVRSAERAERWTPAAHRAWLNPSHDAVDLSQNEVSVPPSDFGKIAGNYGRYRPVFPDTFFARL